VVEHWSVVDRHTGEIIRDDFQSNDKAWAWVVQNQHRNAEEKPEL
jgi:hypothetical protein